MSIPSVSSEKALDKLLVCLASIKNETPPKVDILRYANALFSIPGASTEHGVKHQISRKTNSRKYALVDQRYARVQSSGILNNPLAVLDFLCQMANAADDTNEQLYSTVSMVDPLAPESGSKMTSTGYNSTIFSDIMNTLTPRGDHRQDSFAPSGPRFESTPRNPNSRSKPILPVESSLIGASSGKILTEAQLLRDTLFTMENIPGHYIKWNQSEEIFQLDPRHRVDPRDQSVIETLSMLGFYLKQINAFLDLKKQDQGYGMVGQALIISIDAEISDYLTVLGSTRGMPGLTLLLVKRYFSIWLEKLKYITLLIENIGDRRGGEMLTVLYYFIQHGHPTLKLTFQNILDASARPFFVQLDLWIYEGILHDPFNEFLVGVDLQTPNEQFWSKKYHLKREFIPTFVTQNQAEKILLIGKSINFLREVCNQSNCEIKSKKIPYEGGEGLDREVVHRLQATYEATSRRLLTVFNEKYNLPAHFKAMRSYLLLGQGDFVRHLLDILQEELTKPASNLYRRNLAEQLETAIRCTNAQYDDPEVLKSLDVRLHDINPGDVGWDVFSLNYSVSGPLLTIFPTDVMRKYIRVFNFLLRAKRMEYNLNHLWGQMMYTSKQYKIALPEANEVFHSSNILSHEMGFFINQVQYYINFEILECSWAVLVEKIENAKDLDELIAGHLQFLDELAEGCFLADELWSNLKALRSIFDQIVRYESFQKKIFVECEAECNARKSFGLKRNLDISEDEFAENERRGQYQETLQKYTYKIGQVRHTYQTMVRDFLSGLNKSKHPSLRSLSWRIDFNGFYKNSEI